MKIRAKIEEIILKSFRIFCLSIVVLLQGGVWADQIHNKVEKPVDEAISILQKTQENEEEWRVLREKLSSQLDTLTIQVEQLTNQRDDLKTRVAQTRERIVKKQQQLDAIHQIEEKMAPFLTESVQEMSKLPDQQLPFLTKERTLRMARLQKLMEDPEISLSEKFRKTMEALYIEAEFGLNVESTQEMIDIADQKILVNTFRLGRAGLYYVTLDERQCGFYNLAEKRWDALPDTFLKPLQTAVDIAGKRRPIEFINMPLGKMITP